MKVGIKTKLAMSLCAAVLVSCGQAKSSGAATAKESVPSSGKLSCGMMYLDSSIKKEPLFTNYFDVALPLKEGKVEMFGVTPDTSDYYAAVMPNNGVPDQVALQLGRISTKMSSTSLFSINTVGSQGVGTLALNDHQTFVLSCTRL